METPHSARSESLVNLPMAELDDHRNQPQSLPPRAYSNTISPLQGRPDLTLIISDFDRASSRASARSHEHAIVDDNDHLQVSSPCPESVTTPLERRDSVAPGRARADSVAVRCGRPQIRRPDSRPSSRSPSPPNSVEAFADPERRRAERSATISSHAPTDLGLQLRRTVSRRNTFDEGEPAPNVDTASLAEEDVCFPMPKANKINGRAIDFEEMEEFIAQQRREAELSNETYGRSYEFLSSSDEFLKDAEKQPNSDPEEFRDDASLTRIKETPGPDHHMRHPNRFSFFSSEIENTIHAPEIGYLLCEGETFEDLFQKGDGIWWLDVYNPTDAEFRMLMKAFCVHPLTAEDIRTQEAREKVELFKSYYFVSFRSFVQDPKSPDFMEPLNVYIVVFREGVLSFHFKPAPHSGNVRKRIRQLRDYVSLSPDWICYALIDDITDSFGPVIQQIETETDIIEDNAFTLRDDDQVVMLKQIGECRKKVMGLMRLLGAKADVIKCFAKRCNEQFSMSPRQDIGLYLGDIQDHVITMMGNLAHFEKMLSRSHSNYLAQLSVEGIRTNNQANETLAKITTLATILVPMNLICGIFGMNVPVPGQHSDTVAWWFLIVGIITAFVLAAYFGVKKMKLI